MKLKVKIILKWKVFLIENEKERFFKCFFTNENWRVHKDLKGKKLPIYISIVKYDSSAENRLKTFSRFKGSSEVIEN